MSGLPPLVWGHKWAPVLQARLSSSLLSLSSQSPCRLSVPPAPGPPTPGTLPLAPQSSAACPKPLGRARPSPRPQPWCPHTRSYARASHRSPRPLAPAGLPCLPHGTWSTCAKGRPENASKQVFCKVHPHPRKAPEPASPQASLAAPASLPPTSAPENRRGKPPPRSQGGADPEARKEHSRTARNRHQNLEDKDGHVCVHACAEDACTATPMCAYTRVCSQVQMHTFYVKCF